MAVKSLRAGVALVTVLITSVLGACGGGGGSAECTPGVSTMLYPNGCGGGTGAVSSAISLALSDAAGATTLQITPDSAGRLQATVRDSSGTGVPNAAVTFTTTDKTAVFVPASGTALTDANGVATIGLAAGSQAGAFTVTANAVVKRVTLTGSTSYGVAFPTIALSPLTITPSTLSAGGNASVSVAITSAGAPYTSPLSVSFTSACIAAGKATIGSPVLSQNGTATASYSDKGCGVPDTLTATAKLGDAAISSTGTITVLPASAGSIKFATADTTNIALAGTGGFGRQEFSTLRFAVYDTTGNPVAGQLVDFVFADSGTTSTLGGLVLNPSFATSGADGSVTTLVQNGTLPTSVRVKATVRGSQLATLSDLLVVSTGVPDQRHVSLSSTIGNCEGQDYDQECSIVTATLGDHFGNPVPDGTAVNFTAEGGVIGASCVTGSMPPAGATPAGQTTNSKVGPGSGTCSVVLRSANPRPANRRITVTAYALGEEDFLDTNGNNVFDTGDTFTDKSPDLFRDDDENFAYTPGEPCVGPNSNATCTSAGDGQYNGVLRRPQQASPQALYVHASLVTLFSGSNAVIGFPGGSPTCSAPGSTVDVPVTISDNTLPVPLPMPAGSKISFINQVGNDTGTAFPSSATVNNYVLGIGGTYLLPTYTISVGCPSSKLIVTITTPNGVQTSASLPIN